jgi:hypothetical protein
MRIEDLVVLQYASNNCYAQVIDLKDLKNKPEDRFRVDVEKGLWNYRCWENVEIGQRRSPYDQNRNKSKSGIIGVYDRTNVSHLDNMVHDVKSALDSDSHCIDD